MRENMKKRAVCSLELTSSDPKYTAVDKARVVGHFIVKVFSYEPLTSFHCEIKCKQSF